MRKFRGKRVDNGEWAYGSLVELEGVPFIVTVETPITHKYIADGSYYTIARDCIEVIPESVGQSTGLKDKKGKEGYQSDTVRFYDKLYVIEWNICNACFYLKNTDKQQPDLAINNLLVSEIIGDIHSPELMEKE